MMKGMLNQGFFYVAENKQYRVRSAWLVSGAYGARPLSGRIAEVENPRRALRSEPDTIEVALDVGIEERTLVEWAIQGERRTETVGSFMGRRTYSVRRGIAWLWHIAMTTTSPTQLSMYQRL